MPLASLAEIVAAVPPDLSREVFGNVPAFSRLLFYALAAVAAGLWIIGVARHIRRWRRGRRRDGDRIDWGVALRRLVRDVLCQHRIWGRPWASFAHVLLFSGFVVLLIATILIGFEHWLADLLGRAPGDPVFHKGLYFALYESLTDMFGVAFLVGCVIFLVRRISSDESFAHSPADVGILVLLITIGITGYLVEGLRIIHAQTPLPTLSPVGYAVARWFAALGVSPQSAGQSHFVLWWAHAVLALGFIALMPYTRLLHAIAGTVSLAVRDHAHGLMQPVTLEEVEATGKIGVATLTDFSWRQLAEIDACVSCGRCQDACPAFEVGKPLSPRNVVQDLAAVMNTGRMAEQQLPGVTIADETLWSCTTCGACPEVCPLGISPMRMITDMRRFLIGEGALRGAPAAALQKTDRVGNPWGLSPNERMAWANELDVPLARDNPDYEILYWVGCAAAYDRRAQKIARSVVRLLKAANVNFAILGTDEQCTGESARRMGDELLFQQLAARNIETLERHGARRIVAHCPHCVNSFCQDYSQMGGNYEVVHHSQLLAELIEDGRLPSAANRQHPAEPITYHDPCYLARTSGITEQPRAVLAAASNGDASSAIMELPRNRRNTSCCGAGGGRMWVDDPVAQRVGQGRVREVVRSGAETIAVSCPFCLVMLGDGVAAQQPNARVRDIAEILAESLLGTEPHQNLTAP